MSRFRPANRSQNQGRKLYPSLENLEGRLLMYAASGNRFSTGADIRFSIVPDGTDLGGVKSNLYATFDKEFGAGVWEPILMDSAAWWEYYANLNMTYVYDNGAAIGSGNYQQGNPNFGDIRIGGFAQANNVAAFTLSPPPANGDSSSGDIFLNTSINFSIGSGIDLESIMTHEFGHALGLAHSTDSTAVMYANYTGVKPAPASDDINGIWSVWGARQPDAFTKADNNTIFQNAADITSYTNQYNEVILPSLDLTFGSNTNQINNDWFKVTTPASASSTFAAVVQSSGLSLLSPQVQIYDANAHLLSQADSSTSAYGAITGTQITDAKPNTTYYIRVAPETNYANADGAFALILNMGSYNIGPVSPPNTVVGTQPSQGGGGMSETVTTSAEGKKADPLYDFTHVGTLESKGDDLTLTPAQVRQESKKVVSHNQAHPSQRTWAKRLVTTKQHSTTA